VRTLFKRRGPTGIKTPEQIELMRISGRLVHEVLGKVREMVRPGVTTGELNAAAEEIIRRAGAVPLFRGVKNKQAKFPFPAALCTSVNSEVVHGIPSERKLVEGDVVSVDCGVRLNGFCGDSATTIPVGHIADEVQRLLTVTREALEIAIAAIRPNRWWSEIAGAIQAHVERAGFSVVREFVGHGIGRDMHEEPKVPNYVDPRDRKQDFMLLKGMTLAVEPMVNAGTPEVDYEDDTGWPVVAKDGRCSAHFEHTVAVTLNGADVLTDGR
jgi:methionyl aminopeptidase